MPQNFFFSIEHAWIYAFEVLSFRLLGKMEWTIKASTHCSIEFAFEQSIKKLLGEKKCKFYFGAIFQVCLDSRIKPNQQH